VKKVLDECSALLNQSLERVPWQNKPVYGDWLAQTFYYVEHSTRLLAASAARFACDERGNALHQRFAAHMGEEKRHELLALHDIKALGLRLEDFAEHHATRMFYEAQYYKIEHQDPLALFGYILPLEAMSINKGKWLLERVHESYGNRCTTFLKVHIDDDADHIEKAFAALEAVSPQQRALIELNMRQTTFGYMSMLAEVSRAVDAVQS
jgi:thiaminase